MTIAGEEFRNRERRISARPRRIDGQAAAAALERAGHSKKARSAYDSSNADIAEVCR